MNEKRYKIQAGSEWWIDLRQVRSIELREHASTARLVYDQHIFLRYKGSNHWDEFSATKEYYEAVLNIWRQL